MQGSRKTGEIRSEAASEAELLGVEREDGEARAGRNRFQIFNSLVAHVLLGPGLRVQQIDQQDVDGIAGFDGLHVGVDVWRQSRKVGGRSDVARVFVESGEGLRFAVFLDVEIFPAEVWDGLAFVIGHDDI